MTGEYPWDYDCDSVPTGRQLIATGAKLEPSRGRLYFSKGLPGVQMRGDAEASDSAETAARSVRRAFIRT